MTNINTIEVKSILTNSGIPGADYVINPYLGCLHGCKYCYADFMKRFSGHPEEWGTFIDVKINAHKLLSGKVIGQKSGVIMLSSVTDCYNPAEKDYKITRKILEELPKDQFEISILSKSALAARDVDLFKKFSKLEIGFSFSSHSPSARKIWEPNASDPEEKAQAMGQIHQRGVKTYLFISSILPGITDLEEIIKLNLGNFDFIMAEALNLTPKVRSKVQAVIQEHYPEFLGLYKGNLDEYWDEKYAEYRTLVTKYKLKSQGFHRHGRSIRK